MTEIDVDAAQTNGLEVVARRSAPRKPGALKGQIWMADDFDDFTARDESDWYGGD